MTAPPVESLVRSSGVSFAGALVSAAAGLALVVVLGRVLGAAGAGVVMQAIAVFTISLGVAKFGLDTTAVWLLPQARSDAPSTVRGIVGGLLAAGFVAGLLVAAAVALLTSWIFDGPGSSQLSDAVRVVAWFLPAAVVATIGLAATRGLGGIGPFTLIGNVAVPGLRPVAVLAVGALGGGAGAAVVAWAAVLAASAVPVLAVLARRIKRVERQGTRAGSRRLHRATATRAGRFALPRAAASSIELAQQWLDVVVVGALAGPAAAGVYGAATRFVGAGMIPSTSMRLVVAPQLSTALHRGEISTAEDVYRRSSSIIVLLSAPIYVTLALFGGTVLALLGPEFVTGAPALAVLCVGATVFIMTGNVQSVLLMSGRSGWVAVNKTVVLMVLIAGLVILVPVAGLVGAAVAWSASMVVDAALASLQVDRLVRVRLDARRVLLSWAVAGGTFLAIGAVFRSLLGDSVAGLALTVAGGPLAVVAACVLARGPLGLETAVQVLRRGHRHVAA